MASRLSESPPRMRVSGFFESAAGPLHGGDQFGRADAAVVVGVNQGGGFGIELQSGNGAGQRHPQFLVELIQAHQIRAGFEPHLVEAAGAVEPPWIIFRGGRHGSIGYFVLNRLPATGTAAMTRTTSPMKIPIKFSFMREHQVA
jgi:hypothetical protein